jgi:hypothetical protein
MMTPPIVYDWTPVHTAAAAIVDIQKSTQQTLHLNHSKPVEWALLINGIATRLKVLVVKWPAMLRRPARIYEIAAANPALKLPDFLRECRVTAG